MLNFWDIYATAITIIFLILLITTSCALKRHDIEPRKRLLKHK
jgi:hypothetical protein